MRYSKLLESMNPKVTRNVSVKRYNLSDMISESYRALYKTKEGTNLRKLAEAHLEDVRKNPTQIERLSAQLCKLNAMSRMVESGKVKDQELLVPEKSHDTVDPKKERALDLEEGKESTLEEAWTKVNPRFYKGTIRGHECTIETESTRDGDTQYYITVDGEELDDSGDAYNLKDAKRIAARYVQNLRGAKEGTNKSENEGESLEEEARPYQWSTEWQKERGKLEKFKYYSTDMLLDSDEIVGVIIKDETDGDEAYGVEIYDTTSMETIDGFNKEFDTEEDAKQWVENWFSSNEGKHCDSEELDEASEWDADWNPAGEQGIPCRFKQCLSQQSRYVGTIYEPEGEDYEWYGADIYDNQTEEILDNAGFETEEEAKKWVEDWMSKKMEESVNKEIDESSEDDLELTDEEKEELKKHLDNIRKDKKMSECDGTDKSKKPLKEAGEMRVCGYGVDILCPADTSEYTMVSAIERALMQADIQVVGCASSDVSWTPEEYGLSEGKKDKEEIVDCKESKSWSNINLTEFAKKSSGKAFTKTFKKLAGKLKEGTALTRSETMSLYKATNSAMTHLSVELEHNPGFLSTFNESMNLLQSDNSKILEGMKVNKAPSKATMKHLSKFVESLLNEGRGNFEDQVLDAYAHFTEDSGKIPDISDVMEFLVTHYDISDSGYSDKSGIEAARLYSKIESILSANGMEFIEESEEPLIEEEEEEAMSDQPTADVPDELSEEEEEFLQDYADAYAQARTEIHKELEDKYGESDDPGVQERLAQDAEEVSILNGEEESEEEEPADDPESEGDVEDNVVPDGDAEDLDEDDDSELTDDELAELKRHLEEMRKSKKANLVEAEDEESRPALTKAEAIPKVKKALEDAGIDYTVRGPKGDMLIVAKKELERATEIRAKFTDHDTVSILCRA